MYLLYNVQRNHYSNDQVFITRLMTNKSYSIVDRNTEKSLKKAGIIVNGFEPCAMFTGYICFKSI
jgi:hypothetical protein